MPSPLQLIPYTPALAEAWQQGRLAEALGLAELPHGWPTFPEGLAAAHACQPESKAWGPFLFLRADGRVLLGNGGFKGAPVEGVVELGYEIAPAHRGQGWAQAAVRAMLALAWAQAGVQQVQAHTLAEPNPSTGVLRACGFLHTDTLADAELGSIWRWRLNR